MGNDLFFGVFKSLNLPYNISFQKPSDFNLKKRKLLFLIYFYLFYFFSHFLKRSLCFWAPNDIYRWSYIPTISWSFHFHRLVHSADPGWGSRFALAHSGHIVTRGPVGGVGFAWGLRGERVCARCEEKDSVSIPFPIPIFL